MIKFSKNPLIRNLASSSTIIKSNTVQARRGSKSSKKKSNPKIITLGRRETRSNPSMKSITRHSEVRDSGLNHEMNIKDRPKSCLKIPILNF